MSNTLKHYRKKAGLTRQELAYMADISARTLEAYEQGLRPLDGASAGLVLKLARILHCTVEDLIDPKDTE